ncbi:MAG: TlpA disulfide reductase family protein [Trueperaceae bacterium]
MGAEESPTKRVRRGRLIAAVTLVAALLATGWLLFKPSSANAKGLPDVALEALAGGDTVNLAHVVGRPVVVNLWATWCPPCRRELPMLAAAARSNPGVGFYFVDQGETRETVQSYLDERKDLDLNGVLLDDAGELSNRFGAVGLPVTLFFDANGRHVLTHLGEVTEVEMINYLSDLKRGRL